MTREEALNILHNASVYHPDYLDALNMAIEALEQEPVELVIESAYKTGYELGRSMAMIDCARDRV